ncbi:MAG: hypothetical protein ACYSOF_04295 [Planctomycetota bacterium]|jgi:hypothetical protein
MMAMGAPGGMEWIFIVFIGMGGLLLRLAFMVFVIVFLFKIHKAVTNLQQKVDLLEQKHTE